MFIVRAALAVIMGVMLRRMYLFFRSTGKADQGPGTTHAGSAASGQNEADYGDLTEQGIDDADFEEIP